MAEQQKPVEDDIKKKCTFSGATLKRVRRYYRDGKYFKNKNAYRGFKEGLKVEGAAEAETKEAGGAPKS